MNRFVFVDDSGNPAYTATVGDSVSYSVGEYYGPHLCQTAPTGVSDDELMRNWYWRDGWKIRSPRPSEFHDWEGVSESWVFNHQRANIELDKGVDTERNRRIDLPLFYDDKLLDADSTAQKNLSDKLQEVRERARLSLPMDQDLLVWRDKHNITHVWDDEKSYLDWLAGFAITLSERGTRIYRAAWQHKEAIHQLVENEDIEALLNYDVEAGWPE